MSIDMVHLIEKELFSILIQVFFAIHIEELLFGASMVDVVVDKLTNVIIHMLKGNIKVDRNSPIIHNHCCNSFFLLHKLTDAEAHKRTIHMSRRVLHKPIIVEMKGNDVSLVAVAKLSNDIVLAIPRVNCLHNFLMRVSNLTKDEEENVSEEDSDNTSEDKAKDGEEKHTKLLLEENNGYYECDDKVSKDKNVSNNVFTEETETEVAKNRPVNSKTSERDYKEKQANQGVMSGGHIFSPLLRFVKYVLPNSSEIVKRKREGR